MNIIAIDPGLKGGIATCFGGIVEAHPMPLSRGESLDLPKIAEIFKNKHVDFALIEKVHAMPKQGVVSMFSFGMGYGQLQGLLAGLGIPFHRITPQEWQGLILPGKAKGKLPAIDYCQRRFPGINLVAPGCRVPHDGMADALCLLEYGSKRYHKIPQESDEINPTP
jgi:crossover junction endodeoxyribonuclease RuvC